MRHSSRIASIVLSSLFTAAVIGCDDKVAEKKTVEKSDGTTVEKKETVKKEPDGTTKVEQKSSVDRPGTANDESTKVKVEQK